MRQFLEELLETDSTQPYSTIFQEASEKGQIDQVAVHKILVRLCELVEENQKDIAGVKVLNIDTDDKRRITMLEKALETMSISNAERDKAFEKELDKLKPKKK